MSKGTFVGNVCIKRRTVERSRVRMCRSSGDGESEGAHRECQYRSLKRDQVHWRGRKAWLCLQGKTVSYNCILQQNLRNLGRHNINSRLLVYLVINNIRQKETS